MFSALTTLKFMRIVSDCDNGDDGIDEAVEYLKSSKYYSDENESNS